MNGKIICTTGGKQCLEEYVLTLMPIVSVYETTYEINGLSYKFIIDGETGMVFNKEN